MSESFFKCLERALEGPDGVSPGPREPRLEGVYAFPPKEILESLQVWSPSRATGFRKSG